MDCVENAGKHVERAVLRATPAVLPTGPPAPQAWRPAPHPANRSGIGTCWRSLRHDAWARALLLILLAVVGGAEVIDRIAITVGSRAITESDILREIRLAAFFSQTEPDLSPQGKRQAAGRLVERALIEIEMEAGQYEFPDVSEVAPDLAALKKDRFPIAVAGLGEKDVQRGLLEQLALDSFIDERFGPAVQISDDDMRAYYTKHFVPAWENEKKGAAPPFEEVRAEIGPLLRKQRADALLDSWLKEARGRIRIEFKDEALR